MAPMEAAPHSRITGHFSAINRHTLRFVWRFSGKKSNASITNGRLTANGLVSSATADNPIAAHHQPRFVLSPSPTARTYAQSVATIQTEHNNPFRAASHPTD